MDLVHLVATLGHRLLDGGLAKVDLEHVLEGPVDAVEDGGADEELLAAVRAVVRRWVVDGVAVGVDPAARSYRVAVGLK